MRPLETGTAREPKEGSGVFGRRRRQWDHSAIAPRPHLVPTVELERYMTTDIRTHACLVNRVLGLIAALRLYCSRRSRLHRGSASACWTVHPGHLRPNEQWGAEDADARRIHLR